MTNEMTNIDLFDEYTARVLAMLYENFPVRIGLDATKISGVKGFDDAGSPLDESGNRSIAFEICYATIEWLIDAGYINVKNKSEHGYGRCVLTARGLEVLKSVPESIQRKESVGEKIVTMIKFGSIDLAKEAAKAAISAGIGIMK